jgi:hypothetical protein
MQQQIVKQTRVHYIFGLKRQLCVHRFISASRRIHIPVEGEGSIFYVVTNFREANSRASDQGIPRMLYNPNFITVLTKFHYIRFYLEPVEWSPHPYILFP